MNKFLRKIGLTSKITRKRLEEFVKQNSSDGLTLDVGCKNSPYAKYFSNRVGLDIEEGEGVDVKGDIHQLPFEENKFENILCTEVLEHTINPEQAIKEMQRVLKPGGKLILSTRFVFPLHDTPNDYFRFTKYGLKYLFRNWEIIELKEETKTLEAMAVLYQRLGFQTEILNFKPFKILFFLKAKIILLLKFLITKEYSDINKSNLERNIITSGYYLVAKKK